MTESDVSWGTARPGVRVGAVQLVEARSSLCRYGEGGAVAGTRRL